MKRTGISYLAFAICCFLTLSLTACGQRGPLYLPETEKQVEKAETKAAAEESVDNDAEESDEETPRA